jgi:glycosyltransferase involved in cell wall biosynthesis
MLIILPDHLRVSGVTTWAIHAVEGLRDRSIPAGLIVHTQPGESVPDFLAPYIVGCVTNATPIHHLYGCLDEIVPVYLKAINEMYAITKQPVVVAPNLHGDCYGAIATIARNHPNLVRVVSWIHSDNEYDIAVAKRFEPMLHAIVPVSRELENIANRKLPLRSDDIHHIPYCIEVEQGFMVRESAADRPLRIVYTGRIHEQQKRTSTLPLIARRLNDLGLDFEFRIVGDGPEMDELLRDSKSIEQIKIIGSVPPGEVRSHLQWADLWVLPSRYEGQSVAMLEALSQGCIPIVTQVRSGSHDAVIDGHTGMSVKSDWNTPIEVIADRICDAIMSARSMDMDKMAHNAHRLAFDRHRVSLHIDSLVTLTRQVNSHPDRPWPKDLRASYSAAGSELDGSTPPDAAKRMMSILKSLEGKRVLIYCSGQHTKDISSAIHGSPAEIVGIIDDDPSKVGTGLIGYPIYTADMIPDLGATELVISSWIYEDTIWSKKETIEKLGVCLHRLYPVEESRNSMLTMLES